MDVPFDSELIISLQSGDIDALGTLYDRHSALVYRTAYAIAGDPEMASDLLQDVFVRLSRFSHRIDPRRPLEPWLYRMTANLSYTWLKRRKRWLHPLDDAGEWLLGSPREHSLQQQAEKNAEMERLHQAILKLPVQQRVVVVMYYINDLSLQEIADVLEIPIGTVKSRLHYGRQSLRKVLNLDADMQGEVTYEFT